MSEVRGARFPAIEALQVDAHRSRQPLRECVRDALEEYFSVLDGHDCRNLFDLVMREVEGPLLEQVMRHTHGNQTRAAEILGINRGTLRKKLKLHKLA
ncbi:MAG: DNA-binding transcriptional regulator Fis [Gammaproteobacteria bacterium]|nr:DNA-binding transcriptional regulator Fis [Gammaproteobacteria bacterium]